MIMKKKKLVMIGIICGLLAIAGFSYSCMFKRKESTTFVSSMENTERQEEQQNSQVQKEHQSLQMQDIPENSEVIESEKDPDESDGEELFYIHICGAVMKPGVYRIAGEARLCEVIGMAGGLTQDADGDYINQAQIVMDGQRIYIPAKKETKELSAGDYIGGDSKEQTGDNGGLININKATKNELMELPGIGQAKADCIIEYREKKGNFETVEELMEVSGIKEGLFNRISSNVTVK
jgi:competence protein ComEA